MVLLHNKLYSDVAVIICTFERHSHLQTLLNSLVNVRYNFSFKTYIVDQSIIASNEDIVREAARLMPANSITYFKVDFVGRSKALNFGIRNSIEQLVVFTDDDCIVTNEWFNALYRTFNDTGIDGVFGRVLAYGHQDEITYRVRVSKWGETAQASREDGMMCDALNLREESKIYSSPCLPYANLGSGNNMAFRRTVFKHFGLFRTCLGPGTSLCSAEDTEFQYRLLREGRSLLYNHKMLVYHNGWRTKDQTTLLKTGYDIGIIAVFIAYTFLGERLAAQLMIDRIKQIYRKNKGLNNSVTLVVIKTVMQGLIGGCRIYFGSIPRI